MSREVAGVDEAGGSQVVKKDIRDVFDVMIDNVNVGVKGVDANVGLEGGGVKGVEGGDGVERKDCSAQINGEVIRSAEGKDASANIDAEVEAYFKENDTDLNRKETKSVREEVVPVGEGCSKDVENNGEGGSRDDGDHIDSMIRDYINENQWILDAVAKADVTQVVAATCERESEGGEADVDMGEAVEARPTVVVSFEGEKERSLPCMLSKEKGKQCETSTGQNKRKVEELAAKSPVVKAMKTKTKKFVVKKCVVKVKKSGGVWKESAEKVKKGVEVEKKLV